MLNVKGTITKSDWLAAQQCLGMAWYGLRAGSTSPTEAELFRMEQGLEIGSRARELYPNGIVVATSGGRSPAEITQELIADPSIETLFEAALEVSPFVARADVLKRQGEAWHVLEVKSNFSDTSEMTGLIDDLAYTVMVLQRAGLPVARASLVLLSRDYRFGDGTNRLFEVVDKTTEVSDRATEFEEAADSVAGVLLDQTRPIPVLVSACRSCAVYEDRCLGSGLAHTVLELTGLHHTKLKRLSSDGNLQRKRKRR